ncbi:MAG: hypothetical protein AAFX06_16140 [Planctomycetota bacterium]
MIRRFAPFAFSLFVLLIVTLPMFRGDRIAFRDVNHFYLPLYDYVAHRTSTEWLPLWNPLDQMGMPLVGESTTAVLYPVRYVIFLLPFEPVTALNLYLITHLVIASFCAAWLAKRIGCASQGITLAGITYPLSGSVYALCCNPPFLVGAAWLPLALGACLLGVLPARHRIGLGAISLAMMVLGGDPQSALHVILVAGSVALVIAVGNRILKSPTNATVGSPRSILGVTFFAATLALGLSAIQVAASIDWSRQSDRALDAEHRREAFEFSLPPWHLTELLTPRPFGEPFPRHRRLGVLLPGDGRLWTPSVYGGAIVGIALLLGMFQVRNNGQRTWLWIAIVSMTLCFGHFGAVWVVQQIPGMMRDWDSAVGGPYWMLWSGLKGYSAFRYPIKWLPVFGLAAAMVTAKWVSSPSNRIERTMLRWLALIALVAGLIYHGFYVNNYQFETRHVDEYWGPLDQRGGWWIARNSWWITAVFLFVLAQFRRRNASRAVSCMLLLLVAMDVGWSARRMLPWISVTRESELLEAANAELPDATRTLRTQSGSWPLTWQRATSDDRALEVAVSERLVWFGRWHLADREAVFNSTVSIQTRRLSDFWHAVNAKRATLNRDQQQQLWDAIRGWLSLDGGCHLDGERSIRVQGTQLARTIRFQAHETTFARVWTDWQTPKSLEQLVSQLADGEPVLPAVALDATRPADNASSAVTVIDRDRLLVKSDGGCLLERCQLQDGHWIAQLESTDGRQTRQAVVLPSSHLNQAVFVPPGDWLVQFEYRPWWKWPTILCSGFSWLILLGLARFPRPQFPRGD